MATRIERLPKSHRHVLSGIALVCALLLFEGDVIAAPKGVSFSVPSDQVEAYDYVEIAANVDAPDAQNPFEDASVRGTFESSAGRRWNVDGFCDSVDGRKYLLRFMPSQSGTYKYSVTYQQGQYQNVSTGTLSVMNGQRRGPIRIDPKYPWHFLWEGTGEHYFFNGTTAYWLVPKLRLRLFRCG